MNNKIILIFLVLISLFIAGCDYKIVKEENNQTKNDYESINFKDFNKNPESYYGKRVIIEGKLVMYPLLSFEHHFEVYGLRDSEDYMVKFTPEIDRSFQEDKTYSIIGIVDKDIQTGCLFDCGWTYFINEGKKEVAKVTESSYEKYCKSWNPNANVVDVIAKGGVGLPDQTFVKCCFKEITNMGYQVEQCNEIKV